MTHSAFVDTLSLYEQDSIIQPIHRKGTPAMKKALSLLLALCLLCVCCVSGLSEAATLHYEQNGFTAEIPEGWVYGYTEGASTFYYAPVEGSTDNAMLMIMMTREDSLIGVEMTEEELTEAYNAFIQDALGLAIDGNLSGGYSQIAGTLSVIYWFRQTIDDTGTEYNVAYDMAIIDGWTFGMVLLHTAVDPEALANVLNSIALTVAYDSAAGNASSAKTVSIEDLPAKEDPYRFEPTITNRQNYLTAQWMVDESTRALCTMTLTMDLDISYTDSFTAAYPMNVFASYIGCEDDLIRTIVPSQDETIAYLFEYNASEGTALFYAEPWNEETLAAFEASCTDQYYANTEEALIYIAQLMMSSFDGAAE